MNTNRIRNKRNHYPWARMLIATLAVLLTLSLACAAAEPTPTPVPPAPPAPPAAPTAVPTPTVVLAPAAPTPVPLVPTPTRIVPTPTPVVAAKIQYGGVLRYATRSGLDTLDPHHTVQAATYSPMFSIYSQLVKIDSDANIVPDLAESWNVSADGKAVTLRLRKGAKFQDGTSFNAQAVKWNFDRMVDPKEISPRKGEVEPYIRQVEVVDENTVTLYLYAPYRPLLAQLGSERIGFMVSPAAVAKYGGGKGGDYGRNPVGTGTFRLERWVIEASILLKRNDGYWEKGKPYLDGIHIQIVPETSVRLAMLRTGETDLLYGTEVRSEDVPIIQGDPKLRAIVKEGAGTPMLHFNPAKAPFNNKALRQAIAYAIDRDKFIKTAMPGAAKPGYTAVAVGWASNPDLKPIVFDPAKAKQKLIEAGYGGAATIPIGCPSSGLYLQWCEIYQALLAEQGIKAEPVMILAADFFSALDIGFLEKAGLGPTTWSTRIDPHITVHRGWHSKGFYQAGRRYNNPELDRMIDEAATVYDTAKAKLLYDKIQTIVAEEALMVFVAWSNRFAAMTKSVQDFVTFPDGWERLSDLWLQK